MTPLNSFEELAVHLLLYVARVDGQVHYLEEATLKDLLGGLVADHSVLSRAKDGFKANPVIKIEELLRANESIIVQSTPVQREQLIEALFAVVNSDGKVQGEETEALRTIRKALMSEL